MAATTEKVKPKKPVVYKSGHCATAHLTPRPEDAHFRCSLKFCPCSCHVGEEFFECSGCGEWIVEALNLPLDEDGDPTYVHVDENADMIGQTPWECGS